MIILGVPISFEGFFCETKHAYRSNIQQNKLKAKKIICT